MDLTKKIHQIINKIMQTLLLAFFSTLMVAVLIAIYFLYKKFNETQKNKQPEENLFVMIQNQIQELNNPWRILCPKNL